MGKYDNIQTFGGNYNWLWVDLVEKRVVKVGAGDSYEGGTATRDMGDNFFNLMLEAIGTFCDREVKELKKYAPYDSELRAALMTLYNEKLEAANKYRI